ncbi:L, partial [Symbiodinium sp. KB8]
VRSFTILRVLRILRIARVARAARIINSLPELRVLVKGMVIAMRSTCTILALLLIVVYIFAILFVQLLAESQVGQGWFENVPQAMNFLLLQTLAGADVIVINKLLAAGWTYYLLYLSFAACRLSDLPEARKLLNAIEKKVYWPVKAKSIEPLVMDPQGVLFGTSASSLAPLKEGILEELRAPGPKVVTQVGRLGDAHMAAFGRLFFLVQKSERSNGAACPTQLAQEMRDYCWGDEVCGMECDEGNTPAPGDGLSIVGVTVPHPSEQCCVRTVSQAADINPRSGPYPPYTGSETKEKIVSKLFNIPVLDGALFDASRLILIAGWASTPGSDLFELLCTFARSRCLFPPEIISLFAGTITSGSIDHRLHDPVSAHGTALNMRYNHTTHIALATDGLSAYTRKSDNFLIHFQGWFLLVMAALSVEAAVEVKNPGFSGSKAIRDSSTSDYDRAIGDQLIRAARKSGGSSLYPSLVRPARGAPAVRVRDFAEADPRGVGVAFGDNLIRDAFMPCLRTLKLGGPAALVQELSRCTPNWVFSSVETFLSVDGVEDKIEAMFEEIGADALDIYTPSGAASYMRSIAIKRACDLFACTNESPPNVPKSLFFYSDSDDLDRRIVSDLTMQMGVTILKCGVSHKDAWSACSEFKSSLTNAKEAREDSIVDSDIATAIFYALNRIGMLDSTRRVVMSPLLRVTTVQSDVWISAMRGRYPMNVAIALGDLGIVSVDPTPLTNKGNHFYTSMLSRPRGSVSSSFYKAIEIFVREAPTLTHAVCVGEGSGSIAESIGSDPSNNALTYQSLTRPEDFIEGKVARWCPPCLKLTAAERKLYALSGSLCGPSDLTTFACFDWLSTAIGHGVDRFGKVTIMTCDAFIKGKSSSVKEWLEMATTLGALCARHMAGVGMLIVKCFGTHPELLSGFCSMLGAHFGVINVVAPAYWGSNTTEVCVICRGVDTGATSRMTVNWDQEIGKWWFVGARTTFTGEEFAHEGRERAATVMNRVLAEFKTFIVTHNDAVTASLIPTLGSMGYHTDDEVQSVLKRWSEVGKLANRNLVVTNDSMLNLWIIMNMISQPPKSEAEYVDRIGDLLDKGRALKFGQASGNQGLKFNVHKKKSAWCSMYAKRMSMLIGCLFEAEVPRWLGSRKSGYVHSSKKGLSDYDDVAQTAEVAKSIALVASTLRWDPCRDCCSGRGTTLRAIASTCNTRHTSAHVNVCRLLNRMVKLVCPGLQWTSLAVLIDNKCGPHHDRWNWRGLSLLIGLSHHDAGGLWIEAPGGRYFEMVGDDLVAGIILISIKFCAMCACLASQKLPQALVLAVLLSADWIGTLHVMDLVSDSFKDSVLLNLLFISGVVLLRSVLLRLHLRSRWQRALAQRRARNIGADLGSSINQGESVSSDSDNEQGPGSLPETFHEALVVLLGFSLGTQAQNSRRQFLCGVRLAQPPPAPPAAAATAQTAPGIVMPTDGGLGEDGGVTPSLPLPQGTAPAAGGVQRGAEGTGLTPLEISYDERVCVVCQDEIRPGDRVRPLPKCNHVFHAACLEHWARTMREATRCPTCRRPALARKEGQGSTKISELTEEESTPTPASMLLRSQGPPVVAEAEGVKAPAVAERGGLSTVLVLEFLEATATGRQQVPALPEILA